MKAIEFSPQDDKTNEIMCLECFLCAPLKTYSIGGYRVAEWRDICGEWITIDLEQV